MISLDHAANQMGGAWKMAFGADDWRTSLGRSLDDVFGSAAAFLLSTPLVVVASIAAKRAATRLSDGVDPAYVAAPLAGLIGVDLLTFAIDWAASLALLVLIARATGAGKQAADLIVGFNWIQPIIVAAQLPAIALIAATASRGVGALIGLPAFALALVLIWGIVRRGLHVQAPQAAAIVAMLIAVGVAVDLTGAAIMKALFSPQS